MYACALPSTRFVAIEAFTASDVPSPYRLPPDEVTIPSIRAVIVASSTAVTLTAVGVTATFSRRLVTPLRRSLRTTVPPTAVESDSVTLPNSGIYSEGLVIMMRCQEARSE